MLKHIFGMRLGNITITDLHILSIILSCKKTYGLEIVDELEKEGTKVSLGSIYTHIRRLEKDDLISSELGAASIETEKGIGKHRRKYFTVTEKGRTVIEKAKDKFTEAATEIPIPILT